MITTPEQMREAAALEADRIENSYLANIIRAIHIAPQPVAVTQKDWDAAARAIGVDVYDLNAALTIHPADPLSDPRVKALVEALRHAQKNMPHPDQMIDDALRAIGGEA